MGFGTFLGSSGPDSKESGMIPGPDALCVCGTEKPYGKCCRKYHVAQSSPWQAEDLLRSRYSAYAFQLTSYIMRTTHSSTAELDRRKWRRDILQFCREYNFVGGVDIMEQSMTGPNATSILFRYVPAFRDLECFLIAGVGVIVQDFTLPVANLVSLLYFSLCLSHCVPSSKMSSANLRQRQNLVSFLEMSNFTRESNIWYYVSGKLVDIEDS